MSMYYMINWFFAYSLLGYLLECVVLSYENKRFVFNRGFGHGPFCIIYGFGAIGAYLMLQPVSERVVVLYFATMVMATVMELITARVMIRLFGSFWWDYSQKPYNYKGIICLESSLAWGFLGIFFFSFLDHLVHGLVGLIPISLMKFTALSLLTFYLVDFTYTMAMQLRGGDDDDEDNEIVGRLKVY